MPQWWKRMTTWQRTFLVLELCLLLALAISFFLDLPIMWVIYLNSVLIVINAVVSIRGEPRKGRNRNDTDVGV